MAKYFVNLSAAELARRKERKINYLLSRYTETPYLNHFNDLRTQYHRNNLVSFNDTLLKFYGYFQPNFQFMIEVSGLSQVEFCAICGVSRNLVKKNQKTYLTNLKIHTFLKVYSLFLVYLPSLDFCDMFTLDFRTTFPFLVDQQEENRRKLGKKPLKKAKK
jgi:hypothetical protein